MTKWGRSVEDYQRIANEGLFYVESDIQLEPRHVTITSVSHRVDSFLYLVQDVDTATTTLPPLRLPLDNVAYIIEILPTHSFVHFPMTYNELYAALVPLEKT